MRGRLCNVEQRQFLKCIGVNPKDFCLSMRILKAIHLFTKRLENKYGLGGKYVGIY